MSREHRMSAYDALPVEVRNALRDARYSWPVMEIHERMMMGQTAAELIRLIQTLDDNLYERRRAA